MKNQTDADIKFIMEVMDNLIDFSQMFAFRDRDEYNFYIPEYFRKKFIEELSNKYCAASSLLVGITKYKGVNIVTGYENKIILAHKDYPSRHMEGMYYQIPILPEWFKHTL